MSLIDNVFEKRSDSGRTRWYKYSQRQRVLRTVWFAIFLVATYWSWHRADMEIGDLVGAIPVVRDLLSRMLPPETEIVGPMMSPLIETVHIAIVGIGMTVVLSIPIAYFAAANTAPHPIVSYAGKLVIAITRSIDTLIWAIFLVLIFGSGALAGMLALGIRGIGMVGKLTAEAIEEIDEVQRTAVTATGANPFLVYVYGVVPQIKPPVIGIVLYRTDANVRTATVLGFVGAGGIGAMFQNQVRTFYWPEAMSILVAIIILVIISEVLAAYFRSKVL